MQQNFKRKISSLSQIFSFVNDILTMYKVDEANSFSINLAIEELFTNIVKYNRRTESDITIKITKEEKKLTVKIIDYGGDKFDVSKAKEADVTRRLEERRVGGLGLHLVRKMVDDIQYEYLNGESRITFMKNLE